MKRAMRILIAYDGSECAKAALEDLKQAGFPDPVEALVISVADVFLPPIGSMEMSIPESFATQAELSQTLSKEMVKKACAFAEEAAKNLRLSFPLWNVLAEGFADSPAWGILKKAEEWKPDLAVVGAHGLPATGRLILGSISQKIATEAPCSVRIVHAKPEEVDSPPRLVIGLDGSSFAYEALNEVASRSWKKATAVHLITAVDPRMMTAVFSSEKALRKWIGNTEDRGRRWMDRLTEDAVKKLSAKGLIVTSLSKEGDPKKVLLEEAERWGADCIFVGARGLSGVKHFLTGSVSAALAARAHCTVEIVRCAKAAELKKPAAGFSGPGQDNLMIEEDLKIESETYD